MQESMQRMESDLRSALDENERLRQDQAMLSQDKQRKF